jgi:MoxR-like ATPase
MISGFQQLIQKTSQVVLDKDNEIRLAAVCLLAGGHLLIEDVPGVGKTTLVQTLGKLLGLETHRIQFTIDLLPADILGGHLFNPQDQKFHFHPGPLFAQLVLADELNRASPRTQSALLQAMEEAQVSIDGKTWDLPKPFFVIATQNPHQQSGTFVLPESQLDRFLMSLELNYASRTTEIQLFQAEDTRNKMENLQPIFTAQQLLEAQTSVTEVKVSDVVAQYVGDLLANSRKSPQYGMALSTRAGLALVRAGKAWAFMDGRDYLKPEDLQAVLVPVLGHRLGGNNGLRKGREGAMALQRETAVPV